ncbi:MAG: class I tRNA ligase family protein, partial [Cyanobacteria bacterium J06636_16]
RALSERCRCPGQFPGQSSETMEWSEQGLRPLTSFEHWITVPCPTCGTLARRETDTLDTFWDSSWYFLRFADAHNETAIFDAAKVNNWLPVDLYVCGVEHAVLHLFYARFFIKALRDRGLLNFDEPFSCLLNQGTVQNITYRNSRTRQYIPKTNIVDRDNPVDPQTGDALDITYERASPAKYNSVDPQDVVAEYGADALRLFILSEVPPQMTLVWDEAGVERYHSFLHQVWQVVTRFLENRAASISSNAFDGSSTAERALQQVIRKTIQTIGQAVQGDYQLNMAVSELLEFNNTLTNTNCVNSPVYAEGIDTLVKLLAPFAPHIAEELWHRLGSTDSIHCQPWPSLSRR